MRIYVNQYKVDGGVTASRKVLKMSIKKVSREKSLSIIENRLPLGLFYTIDNGVYIGIDNKDSHAWTEEFKSLGSCKRWLMS